MLVRVFEASLTGSKKACGGVCIYLSGNNDGALSNRDFWQEVWYDINQPIAAGVSALSLIFCCAYITTLVYSVCIKKPY